MKKYTNQSQEMKFVEFTDGEAQFLFRGQSITSGKQVKVIQRGIVATEVQVTPKQQTKKTDSISE